MKPLQIEYMMLDQIKPYAKNAKKHPAEQVEQIKKSIEEFGFNDPIGVYSDGEIAEGHGRLLAAVDLGLEKVPVIVLDGLNEDQKKAYRIVHNQLTMNSGFDIELLNAELADLEDMGMDQYGFTITDISEDQYENFFEDADQKDKEKKKIQCPYCGEWFTP